MKYEEYKSKAAAYTASKQTAAQWCMQEEIAVQTLRTWLKRVKKREEKTVQGSTQGKSSTCTKLFGAYHITKHYADCRQKNRPIIPLTRNRSAYVYRC